DAVAVEQHARAPGVLAGDDVGLAQRREHAQGHVLEVADRRRADDQAAGDHRSESPSKASAAAPLIPASTPNRAATIRTSSREGRSARRATTSRAGPSSSSPAAITPPPMTT